MTGFLIILAIIGGVFLLVCVGALVQRLRNPQGYDVSADEVREQLQEILRGKNPYALDEFISIAPLKEMRLEKMRNRVAQLDEEFPPATKGAFCSEEGLDVIREYIRELDEIVQRDEKA